MIFWERIAFSFDLEGKQHPGVGFPYYIFYRQPGMALKPWLLARTIFAQPIGLKDFNNEHAAKIF
jgi:hypothetical protein